MAKMASGLFSLVLLALSEKAACLTVALGRVATGAAAPSRSRTVRLQQAPFVQGGLAVIANAEDTKLALSFFLEGEATTRPTAGGVNNVVQYVDTPTGERYILRIYNNGGETDRVRFEHSVLGELKKLPISLPFDYPRFVPSLKSGRSTETLPSGNQCCMCQLIPGGLPKTADPRPLGRAAGQLLVAMGSIDPKALEGKSIPPYNDIYGAHPKATRELFYNYIEGPELDKCRADIERLKVEFRRLDAFIEEYLAKGLPQQVIHGDLHYDNVLCDPATGDVTGALDFEFTVFDWRAMELAVCLSKYAGEKDPFPLIEAFVDGFAETGRLTADECKGLPSMINLRVMSNCVYFVGRAIGGEDSIESLTKRAGMYADRCVWVRNNEQRIVDCIAGRMAAAEKAGYTYASAQAVW